MKFLAILEAIYIVIQILIKLKVIKAEDVDKVAKAAIKDAMKKTA